MKVIISGDRHAKLEQCGHIIEEYINSLPENTIIIHGACRGVDMIADYYAKKRNFEIRAEKADWKKYGRAAGPIRNAQMLVELDSGDVVAAFHPDLSQSKGTAHMKKIAEEAGVKVIYFKI